MISNIKTENVLYVPLKNTRKLTATSTCYTDKYMLKETVSIKDKTELNKFD